MTRAPCFAYCIKTYHDAHLSYDRNKNKKGILLNLYVWQTPIVVNVWLQVPLSSQVTFLPNQHCKITVKMDGYKDR